MDRRRFLSAISVTDSNHNLSFSLEAFPNDLHATSRETRRKANANRVTAPTATPNACTRPPERARSTRGSGPAPTRRVSGDHLVQAPTGVARHGKFSLAILKPASGWVYGTYVLRGIPRHGLAYNRCRLSPVAGRDRPSAAHGRRVAQDRWPRAGRARARLCARRSGKEQRGARVTSISRHAQPRYPMRRDTTPAPRQRPRRSHATHLAAVPAASERRRCRTLSSRRPAP